ncbi:hypothetical protein [Actinoplanes utahensis]|uniref:C2H2-type domain-containing protein n=1 Tax=Actinoplanes utahensis TaxID=1869 RepID=A0A0A6UDW0_ACTUT|nr:hypothetical protein [Actinoplanes utahensis]KHD73671.1 hypothetical protein MB27_33435 [Actinoplanes utahensis]GIF34037.1 hypothetical protein Aut01nite_70230 [Actinoplanes utahensis]
MREAVVPYDCADCGHDATAAFGELLLHGRLHWSLSHACAAGPIEACGRDESPTGLRQALLDQCGTYHLRLLSGDHVRVMKVLRDRGTSLRDIPAAVAALRDPGLPGTEAELRLLATHLAAIGATVRLERPG